VDTAEILVTAIFFDSCIKIRALPWAWVPMVRK
jgi:hypothetical protein